MGLGDQLVIPLFHDLVEAQTIAVGEPDAVILDLWTETVGVEF